MDSGFTDYAATLTQFTTMVLIRNGRNWFAYVERDPINKIDLWGLETVVMSQDIPLSQSVHLFIAQQDESTGAISTISLHPERGALAGLLTILVPGDRYTVSPTSTPDTPAELDAAQAFFVGDDLPRGFQYQCTPLTPVGLTQQEFDLAVRDAAGTYPFEDRPYEGWSGPNSNTYIDDIIEASGSRLPDIVGAQAQNWGEIDGVSGAAPYCRGTDH
jgi:hypothetical protein